MSNKQITMFDHLSKRYGITKTWVASQLNMTRQAFDYALERGFNEREIEIIEEAIQKAGKDLSTFKVPSSLKYKKEAA